MKLFIKFWNYISNIGVFPTDGPEELRKIQLINRICFFATFNILIFGPYSYFIGNYYGALMSLLTGGLSVLYYIFSNKRHFIFSFFWILSMLAVNTFFQSIEAPGAGIEYYFIIFSITPFMILEQKIICFSFVVINVFLLILSHLLQKTYQPHFLFTPFDIELAYMILLPSIFFWAAVLVFQFRITNTKYETAILELEKYKTQEQERLRIAKDIHDELGSGLTKIALVAEYSKQHLNDTKMLNDNIHSISKTSKTLVENMKDLVWALNPDNVTLDNLVARIHEYSSEYLEEFPIQFHFDFPEEVPPLKISKEVQRSIFLTFKEALNNSIKHSDADKIDIAVAINKTTLNITIADNGKGFNESEIRKTGNGLFNMTHRIENVGGIFSIKSVLTNGTTVKINLKLDRLVLKA